MDYTKKTALFMPDNWVFIEMEYSYDEVVIFTVNELNPDENESTEDNQVLKTRNTVEVVLGIEETKELIRSLQSLLPEEDC